MHSITITPLEIRLDELTDAYLKKHAEWHEAERNHAPNEVCRLLEQQLKALDNEHHRLARLLRARRKMT